MAAFFIRRPIVAIVIAIVTVLGGLVSLRVAAGGAVPEHRAATDHRDGDLQRRRRADHRAIRGDAARTAGQRRRRHALHAVDQRQRRVDAADGDVRHQHQPQHRSGQRPEPDRAGTAEPAHRRHAVRFDTAQVDGPADDGRLAPVANEHVRRALPRELREHQHHRRAVPRAGRRRSPRLRLRRLRAAHLAAGRSARGDGHHGPRDRPRRLATEHGEPVRPDRRQAFAFEPGHDLHGPVAGAADDTRTVLADHPALESRWLRRPPVGCRARRARGAQLPAGRPRQRPARRWRRSLPGAGIQCARKSPPACARS